MRRRLDELALETAGRVPGAEALRLPDGRCLTYRELRGTAEAVAKALSAAGDGGQLALLWASRGVGAYAGLLGTALAGRGYVPLHPDFPDDRLRRLVERVGGEVVVVDERDLEEVAARSAAWGLRAVVVVGPDGAELLTRAPAGAARPGGGSPEDGRDGSDLAYLLFTSGSTGTPKGVPILHANVVPLLEHALERYALGTADACSQAYDLTFDPSVLSTFLAWGSGAALVVPGRHDLLAPGRWITREQLTLFSAVPSVAAFMRRFGQLAPGAYPRLRASMFGGEALPVAMAQAWAAAAPHALLDNLYGPTEASIMVTGFRWEDGAERHCENGIVPIGWEFPGVRAAVVDDDLTEVGPGGTGELLLGGPQVTDGYWDDPERTDRSFVRPPGLEGRWYRTGDRVRRPRASELPLVHLGRLDDQVKLLGHRVELGEVEAVAREVLGRDEVVAVPWPPAEAGYAGLELFTAHHTGDAAPASTGAAHPALRRMAGTLPPYMVPRNLTVLPELPRNGNGKYDRTALRRWLEERDG